MYWSVHDKLFMYVAIVPDFLKGSVNDIKHMGNVVTNKFIVTSENLLGYHSPAKGLLF